jgi:hypothetical protein
MSIGQRRSAIVAPGPDSICVGGLPLTVPLPLFISGRHDLLPTGAGTQGWLATLMNMPHFMASHSLVYRDKGVILRRISVHMIAYGPGRAGAHPQAHNTHQFFTDGVIWKDQQPGSSPRVSRARCRSTAGGPFIVSAGTTIPVKERRPCSNEARYS